MTSIEKKKDMFFWLGCLMAFVVAVDIFVNLGDWTELFWFCTVTSVLISFGLFRKDARILSACLVLTIPAQSPWVFDFILDLFGMGMGRTAMLRECGPVIYWGSILIHSAGIPVSLWAVGRLGFDRRALVPAMLYGAGLLTASFIFTPPFKNVNCVFFPCDANDPLGGYGTFFLFRALLVWGMIVPASYWILRIAFDRLSSKEVGHGNSA